MADIPNILDFEGVSVSSDDERPGDLEAKIAAGTNVTLATLNPGANEQLEISATAGAKFTSAQQTITSAGALTLAHGLTGIPTEITAYLVNLTAEAAYSVGDILMIDIGLQSSSATDNQGLSVVPDATNLNIRFGANATTFLVLNKTLGGGANITNANWEIVFEAVI